MRKIYIITTLFIFSVSHKLEAQCDFNASNTSICGGEQVVFDVINPQSGTSYLWDFDGNGTFDASGIQATHVFPEDFVQQRQFSVTLYRDSVACRTLNITVNSVPDPSIGIDITSAARFNGTEIAVCNLPDVFELEIINTSSTQATNTNYRINWGDGTPVENFTATEFTTNTINHQFSGQGFKDITIEVTGSNGCISSRVYKYYNGSNPSIGLSLPGNTTGLCAPDTLTFGLNNIDGNPPGTMYEITVNGDSRLTFDQGTVPTFFDIPFDVTSCGLTTSTGQNNNAFDVQAIASNPCSRSTATVEPIELSGTPIPIIDIQATGSNCPGETFFISNASENISEVVNGNPTVCNRELPTAWQISPGTNGVEWEVVEGNVNSAQFLRVLFNQPGTYEITMSMRSNACGLTTTTEELTIVEAPLAQAAFVSADNCADEVLRITNNSSGFELNYEWEVIPDEGGGFSFEENTDTNSENPVITLEDADSYEIRLTTSNLCAENVWDTLIVLADVPEVQLEGVPDVCDSLILSFEDNDIELDENGSTVTQYQWTFENAIPSSSTIRLPQNIAYDTPGTYSYTLEVTNECGTTAVSDTFVVQQAETIVLPDDQSFCRNDATEVLIATPANGRWNGTGVDVDGTFNPQLALPGDNTLTYTFGSGACTSTGSMVVTVNEIPLITVESDQRACVNDAAFTLTANPLGGEWSGTIVNTEGLVIPSTISVGTYPLTYRFQDANGCSNQAEIELSINDVPNIMIADTSYCNAPGLVNLPLANITGGSWDGLGVSGNQFDPTGAGGNGDYVLNYFVTDGNQCTDTLAVNISVVDPDNVEAGADLEICVSETFLDLTVDASPANGSWSVPSFGNIPNGALNPSNLGVGTYTVQYEVGAGNCLVNDQKQLIVHPLPSLDLSGLTTSFCVSQDSILLEALPNGGIWQSNNGGFLRDNFFFPTQSGSGTFTLSYEFTDNQGCISTAIADVVVNELPVVTAADTTVCNVAGTINLPLASPVGGQWSGPGVDNNAFNPTTAGGVGDYTLTYEFTDNNACSSSTTAIISVIEPTTIDAGTDFSVCVSENAVDLFNGVNPVGGTWTEATLGDIPNGLFDAESAGIGTYTFTYSVGAGNCLVTDERVVEVLALPTINLNNPIDEVCENVDGVNFIASPEGGVWTGTGSAVIDSLTFFPNSSGAGIYELTYTYTDGNGCTNAASFDFTVNALPNIVVSDTVICNTPELADLPLALPQDGEWTGTGVVNNQFDAVGAGGIGSYPLMYTFTDLNGCVGRANVNIEVVEPATIDAGPTDTVCIDGGEITLSDFTPINGLWSGPGITDPLGNFDPLLAGGGTQILTYEFGSGNCRVTDTKSIEVIDLRSTSAGNDQTVCLDEPFLQLEGQMPLGGEWSGMGVIENEMGIFVPDSVGVGLQTIVYTFVDDASGCFFSDEKTVEVLPMPESNFSLAAQSCIGDTIQFENNSNSTFLPQWDFGNGDQSMLAEPSYTYQDTGTYLVRLTTQNEQGCVDFFEQEIFITRPPEIVFATNTMSGCGPLPLQIFNASTGFQTTYNWDYGNGTMAEGFLLDTVVTFQAGLNDTTYTILLTARNQCATVMDSINVEVLATPTVNFGINRSSDCTPMRVEFSNVTQGSPETFFWDLDNGRTSTQFLPGTQTYRTDTLPTLYNIQLIAGNQCGMDTLIQELLVRPADVEAFFNVPDTVGCEPLEMPFTSFATPGALVSWEFGDGNTSGENSPVHTFEEAGTYKVVQRATNGCGFDSTLVFITVLPAPTVDFELVPRVCRGDSLTLMNTSINTATDSWEFGDGDTSLLKNPFHIYQQAGDYSITLSATSAENGCLSTATKSVEVLELPIIDFLPSTVEGCVSLEVSFQNQTQNGNFYDWDFGDGNTSNDFSPTHTYLNPGTYAVNLEATDLNACSNDSTFFQIVVHELPIADFMLEKINDCEIPAEVQLIDQSIDAVDYNWMFGDGMNSALNNPLHTYTDSGTYQIQLEVENQFGCLDTAFTSVRIASQPLAMFEVDSLTACAPAELFFRNTTEGANRYFWDFGDGTTSTDVNGQHSYANPGAYDVKLIAFFDDVCVDSFELFRPLRVLRSPMASFFFQERMTTEPSGIFEFINTSRNASSFLWDFGDGNTSESNNAIHRYFTNGPKEVSLTAFGANGCTDDTVQIIDPAFLGYLYVPNALSPDLGTGDSRIFLPKGVGLKDYHLKIYAANGELIWETTLLTDGQPAEGWDGTKEGNPLPQDTYIWEIDAVFENDRSWQGVEKPNGRFQNVGTLLLLR